MRTRLRNPTRESWQALRTRCLNPNHVRHARYAPLWYAPWASFAQFVADMGERPEGMTLDRIDNAKGYSPDNCRWACPKQQARNRRNTKLTQEAVDAIRSATGTQRAIATQFGVTQSQVCRVLSRELWA